MHNLILYSKPECPLCKEAVEVLSHTGLNVQLQEINIEEDSQLMSLYGIRIPVLQAADKRELGWPFGPEDVKQFLT